MLERRIKIERQLAVEHVLRHALDAENADRLLHELFDADLLELRRRLDHSRGADFDDAERSDLMQDKRDRNGDRMRRDDQFFASRNFLQIDSGDGQRSICDRRRLRSIDDDEAIVAVALDPFAIASRRTAKEHEIEIFELVIGGCHDHRRLVVNLCQRAGRLAGGIEQNQFRERKRTLAKDRLDLVAHQRQRIDDADAISRLCLRLRHQWRVSAVCKISSPAARGGKAIDHSRISGPEAR